MLKIGRLGASRNNVAGWLKAPVVVHWNIEKK